MNVKLESILSLSWDDYETSLEIALEADLLTLS